MNTDNQEKKYYFISGLPRSGTTLLSAILNQNPRFQASISSPLARFARAIIEQSSAQGGYRFECDEAKRKKIILGMFNNYYDQPDKDVFFNTNRGWTLLLPLIKDLFPYTKIICCVRDIPWILDSFERLFRKNMYSITNMFSPEENVNVYTRCNTLLRDDRTLGFAFNALKHAITSEEKPMIMLLEYDQLCKHPGQTMKAIYSFIGEEHYLHNFNDVESHYELFDMDVNLAGMHTTRKKLEWVERSPIIPPDIWEKYMPFSIWR